MAYTRYMRAHHCEKRPTTILFGLVNTWQAHVIDPDTVRVSVWGDKSWGKFEMRMNCGFCDKLYYRFGLQSHEVANAKRYIIKRWKKLKNPPSSVYSVD